MKLFIAILSASLLTLSGGQYTNYPPSAEPHGGNHNDPYGDPSASSANANYNPNNSPATQSGPSPDLAAARGWCRR